MKKILLKITVAFAITILIGSLLFFCASFYEANLNFTEWAKATRTFISFFGFVCIALAWVFTFIWDTFAG